jgi:hypothetical protein
MDEKNMTDEKLLPAPDTKRWVARHKVAIVDAVRNGALTLKEVCERYQLSVEEFFAWQKALDAHGIGGLHVTRLQIYRDAPKTRSAKNRLRSPAEWTKRA